MRLVHFSEEYFKFDPNRSYRQQRGGNDKPSGLWLSDESDYGWKQWCRDNEFRTNGLKCVTRFAVDEKQILIISSLTQIESFSDEYGCRPSWVKSGIKLKFIDWEKVTENYAGVIITPYINEARLLCKFFWYYGWDCASGCVWDLSALEMIGE